VTVTDEQLMSEVQAGDLRRLAVLFERHHRVLYNFFVHMTGSPDLSEDLVQDVFFRMLRYRETYDASRSFTGWMYQIARNAVIDTAHKRRGEMQWAGNNDENAAAAEPVSQMPGAEESLRRRQEIRLLRRALDRLPDDKREVLVLSRFQNLAYNEIASILGCEVGAVKVRVYRATRALGQIYFELAGERAS
jgi:RNA polymerase sigma-70 factor (ECF subfamily)